jgi:S1-C subfamily serine protease
MSFRTRMAPAFAGGVAGAAIAAGTLLGAGALDDDKTVTTTVAAGAGAPATVDTSEAPATAARAVYERSGKGVVYIQAKGGGALDDVPAPQDEGSPFAPPRNEGIATGSGFVLDTDGTIVTNAHVVGTSKDVTVRFDEDDEPVKAKVLGTDASTDIAVLKVDPKETGPLTALPLADSDKVAVGQQAIAIGNPFGLDRTATSGIVSAKGREIDSPNGFQIDGIIQTDAPINPGNSGGPLLDGKGRVIGVNSQILTGGSSRGNVGIGFAVPSNTVKEIVPRLKRDGAIERAYLGVSTLEVTEEVAKELDLPTGEGALVVTLARNGPASKAGLRAASGTSGRGGDVILGIDGDPVKDPEDVAAAVIAKKPGDRIRIEVLRGKDRKKITVELGERPQARVR